MGLDNGIEVKKRKDIEFKKDIIDEYGEVCYWRKCWNIRKDIIEINKDTIVQNNIVLLLFFIFKI